METPRRTWSNQQVNNLKHFQQHSRLHFIGQWKTKAHDLFKEWFAANPSWNHGVLSQQALFVHVDMDAFFCSVALAKEANAHLRDQPVCVAAGSGSSDISSCNYIARSFGVCKGMYVNAARKLCPNLHVVGYDLPHCEEVVKCLYRMLFELCPKHMNMTLEVFSIDEVFVAFDSQDCDAVVRYCEEVRQELEESTRCTVSCGIGPSFMLARLATRSAKPNGVFLIRPDEVSSFIEQLPFGMLYGAGSSTIARLRPLLRKFIGDCDEDDDILCRHVQKLTKTQLQQALGRRSGENFYNLCRGNDTRVVVRTGDEANQRLMGKKHPSSVGCSMNYAVRPTCLDDIWRISRELLETVCAKMERGGYSCSALRVTVLERHPMHPKKTVKFMGRGKCVEFHVPVSFNTSLRSGDIETMLVHVKTALGPLFVNSRPESDEERARELGLTEELNSGVIWTVSISTVTNVVISDVRGMTIQATGLRPENVTADTTKHIGNGVQISLAMAFSRATASLRPATNEVRDPATAKPLQPLVASLPQVGSLRWPTLEGFLGRGVDEAFINKWKSVAQEAGRQADYTAVKALIRIAALQCAHAPESIDRGRELFSSLVMFAQGQLPCPLSFT
ncbi:putative impB mucB samB family [Trypanosoma vivax]|uniref:Putative DNA damage repair protein n=1 Tax=Trypanosoma vivax (strain Y486) TaxID=1055687 RepID=G0U695_TRYVY|nr:putative DNA damage repair protein [Trypanosoma vivax]KAH8611921.1 putative impB mucB samB family [Trypanosoma vivax]CCC51398.1 putative DNA damage repair protein [Trypanosoma vivax Y486]